jgi:hypothetical protein
MAHVANGAIRLAQMALVGVVVSEGNRARPQFIPGAMAVQTFLEIHPGPGLRLLLFMAGNTVPIFRMPVGQKRFLRLSRHKSGRAVKQDQNGYPQQSLSHSTAPIVRRRLKPFTFERPARICLQILAVLNTSHGAAVALFHFRIKNKSIFDLEMEEV